ncbi:hypothetical protein [Psychrobacter faecalis]|uniref:hypothetical protein n=1 Tax=Psychrobacter faecalis TaxID=180588 RepID=UPI003FD1EB1D
MNIRMQGEPQDGKVLMQVYIDNDDTPNNAQIDLWVDYNDSMTILRQNTLAELVTFLEESLNHSTQLSLS